MKTAQVVASMLVLAALGAGIVNLSGVLADEKVSLDQVPAAVKTTIEQHAAQAKIIKIEKETEKGQEIYEVEQKIDGKVVEFQVSAAGKYLGPEAEEGEDDDGEDDDGDEEGDDDDDEGEEDDAEETAIAWDQLPKAVQDGLTATLAGKTPGKVTREVEGGMPIFEAEYEAGGAVQSVEVTENGDVVETEKAIPVSALPAAVAARLQRVAPTATVEEASLVTVTLYEVTLKDGEKRREIVLLANGHPVDDEED
ncbi:MAG: PepSY-like domain-containing protein [Candidatus Hydrogenedentes bacterium]|nr:PepSY-like domain-containing protein [Candidatus Hydrogenedentota bacterium]MBI3118759.1 PepSY-like domain-containing protein [Candidatus Hydrogenedentota bacterium]